LLCEVVPTFAEGRSDGPRLDPAGWQAAVNGLGTP